MFKGINRKVILASFVEYGTKQKNILVTKYDLEWSNPDAEYYIHIFYQILIPNRPYMTIRYIKSYSYYMEWEQQYLRRFKLDKLMKKIKNGI